MSRHRKVKALDYDEEYDDYYGAYDDDDDDEDFDGDAFEAQYLNTGIDLNTNQSSNNTSNLDKLRHEIIEEAKQIEKSTIDKDNKSDVDDDNIQRSQSKRKDLDRDSLRPDECEEEAAIDSINSDLTRIAIQHLDKYQWQLPLMEMDKKFRDRTYYKHYTDTYISSLRSKLGHFLADNQLLSNPMRYHLQQELDNYSKYSRMFELLTEYYQSMASGFFSFATPSPDEEIVIGCRLGTKAKKPATKPTQTNEDQSKAARFEFQGRPSGGKGAGKNKDNQTKSEVKNQEKNRFSLKPGQPKDLTVQDNFTAEQLDELSNKYKESISLANKQKTLVFSTGARKKAQVAQVDQQNKKIDQPETSVKKPIPKQLETMGEKRHKLKAHLKRLSEPSDQDLETIKRQSLQTALEYSELVKSSRPRVNLVVVGHVDAGKSTLVGHLLFKLGQVSGKQMHRNEVDSQRSGKASFKFAWAMDETAEERARGVTIDIALTQFETAHREVILLDAPGHVDFIPAVISGAAQADAALLVVDATRGEFETGFTQGGQTREHTYLVRSLGVKSLIVVVNKMDQVDWNWSRFSDIAAQLKPFLKQVGFDLHHDVQFVVCSGLTGDNLVERRLDKVKRDSSHPQLEGDGANWNEMPSLLEAIDKIKPPERMVDKPTRVCLTDVYKGMSSGVFLGAKVVSGKIEAKQRLLLLPPNEMCEVKSIECRDASQLGRSNRAFAGDIIAAVTSGIDMNKYYRGCMLCEPLLPCQVTNRFQARVIMFQTADSVLIKGSPIEIHINGTHEGGQVRKLISLLNKNTGELIQTRPRCLVKNSSAIVQFKLERVVCCELYEQNKDLGRFMVRSFGKTVAAGLITKIKSAKVAKSGATKMRSK